MATKSSAKSNAKRGATAATTAANGGSATVAMGGGLAIQRMRIHLTGDSPLISHRWSDKAREMMLAKQMKEATGAKEAKDPWMDFCNSLYWLTPMPTKPTEADIRKAKFGFPSVAFKSAAVDACSQIAGITKVLARGTFHIMGDFIEIEGTPTMREDMVRVGMGTADIRHRGEFKDWGATLTMRYNTNTLSMEQIVDLFNTGGFAVGVGEWRPEKNGSFGMFHVTTLAEQETGA